MVDKRTDSIYTVSEQEYVDEPDLPAVDYWREQRRKNLMWNLFWALLFICLASGITYILVSTSNNKSTRKDAKWLSSPFKEGETELVMRFDSAANKLNAPQMEIFVDDMITLHPDKLPNDGIAPLNIEWTKQAAYYLVSAERATSVGKIEDAKLQYENVLAIFPKMEGVRSRLGLIELQLGNIADAIAHLKVALTEDGVDPETINNLGSAYMAQEQYENAIKCFTKVLEMKPEHDSSLVNIANSYEKMGQYDKALANYEKYVARHNDDMTAYMGYASLLMQSKQWKKAVDILLQVQQQAPDLGPVYFKLAESLANTGNRAGAVQSLKRGVLLVDPKNALSLLAKKNFDAMRELPEFKALLDELAQSNN